MKNVCTRRLTLAAGLGGVAGRLLAPSPSRAGQRRRVVRLGVVTPLNSSLGQACTGFAEAAAANPELADTIQFEVHANGELGGEIEVVQACIAGIVDLVFATSNVVAALVPELGLLDASFLFRDANHARATLDGPIGAEFADILRAKDMHLLAWGENGLRHVTANRPVRGTGDLADLHIRVPQSAVMVEGFRALGAAPETLPVPQLYEALRTGRFEAQENPVATTLSAHFNEVQRCLSLTGHVYSAAFFLASRDLLDELSDAQRSALISCSRIGAQASRDAAARGERDGIAQLRAAGMKIVEDVDRTALAAKCRPALDAAAWRLGADRAARIKAVAT